MEGRKPASVRRQVQDHWAQSRADLNTAMTLRDAGVFYAAVFFAQQAAEKAVKAVLIQSGHTPKGHNLVDFANLLEATVEIMNAAAALNAEFLITRNPEHAGGVPAQMYDREIADRRIAAAQSMVDWSRALL